MGRYRRVTRSSIETRYAGYLLGQSVSEGSVILLSGDYGVGKTEFVRGVVHGFLGDEHASQVASPSFSTLLVYEALPRRVCHYDLYRMKDSEGISLSAIFQDAEEDDLLCVEWAECLSQLHFRNSIMVQITSLSLEDRELVIQSAFDIPLFS